MYQREISKGQWYFFLLKNKTKKYAEVVLIFGLSKLRRKSTSKQRQVSFHYNYFVESRLRSHFRKSVKAKVIFLSINICHKKLHRIDIGFLSIEFTVKFMQWITDIFMQCQLNTMSYICIYIYIYRERERERECIYIYIYIYI